MKPGIYDGISNAEYHGGPGISKSGLDLIARSPLHYRAVVDASNDNHREPTPAQQLGTAFHCLLLEPDVFVREYCLGLRQADVPHAVGDRDTLVAMAEKWNAEQMLLAADTIKTRDELVARIAALNENRLPKLSTSGTKDELVARIIGADPSAAENADALQAMKLPELKAALATINEQRPGLLSDKGSMAELAQLLRDAGQEIALFSELCEDYARANGRSFLVDAKGSMAEIADGLRAAGHQVTLWADVKAQWLANNGHRTVLEQETWDQLHAMRDAVMAHPMAHRLLTAVPGVAERSVYWIDPKTGELCRCRPDFWREDGIIVDVKTTLDASQDGFARSVANYRYHVQHPYYLDGINHARAQMEAAAKGEEFPPKIPAQARVFLFLAVEKDACVVDGKAKGVAVYMLDDASVRLGRAEYRRDLDQYAECRATGVWPGYGDSILNLSVPQWQFGKNSELLENAA